MSHLLTLVSTPLTNPHPITVPITVTATSDNGTPPPLTLAAIRAAGFPYTIWWHDADKWRLRIVVPAGTPTQLSGLVYAARLKSLFPHAIITDTGCELDAKHCPKRYRGLDLAYVCFTCR